MASGPCYHRVGPRRQTLAAICGRILRDCPRPHSANQDQFSGAPACVVRSLAVQAAGQSRRPVDAVAHSPPDGSRQVLARNHPPVGIPCAPAANPDLQHPPAVARSRHVQIAGQSRQLAGAVARRSLCECRQASALNPLPGGSRQVLDLIPLPAGSRRALAVNPGLQNLPGAARPQRVRSAVRSPRPAHAAAHYPPGGSRQVSDLNPLPGGMARAPAARPDPRNLPAADAAPKGAFRRPIPAWPGIADRAIRASR